MKRLATLFMALAFVFGVVFVAAPKADAHITNNYAILGCSATLRNQNQVLFHAVPTAIAQTHVTAYCYSTEFWPGGQVKGPTQWYATVWWNGLISHSNYTLCNVSPCDPEPN
jgi:hypothetical protein